jgi:hypothetical protein
MTTARRPDRRSTYAVQCDEGFSVAWQWRRRESNPFKPLTINSRIGAGLRRFRSLSCSHFHPAPFRLIRSQNASFRSAVAPSATLKMSCDISGGTLARWRSLCRSRNGRGLGRQVRGCRLHTPRRPGFRRDGRERLRANHRGGCRCRRAWPGAILPEIAECRATWAALPWAPADFAAVRVWSATRAWMSPRGVAELAAAAKSRVGEQVDKMLTRRRRDGGSSNPWC